MLERRARSLVKQRQCKTPSEETGGGCQNEAFRKRAPLGGGAKWVVMQRGRRVRPAHIPNLGPWNSFPLSAEIFSGRPEQNRLSRILNIGSGHRDADHRAARQHNAAPAEPSGELTDDIRWRGFIPAPGTAGGACAPIGCRPHRKLRGGAR